MPLRNVNFDLPRKLTEFVNGAQKVTGAVITLGGGGTGYQLNDILSVLGGTGERIAQLKVTGETAGVIDTVSVGEEGAYDTNPTNPVSVTGGSGNDDATFNLTLGDAIAATTDVEEILSKDGQWYLEYWT